MKKLFPPHWASKFLAHFADPNTSEEVQGDLLEMYQHWAENLGESRARRLYVLNVIKLMRPFAKDKKAQQYSQTYSNIPAMILNYFKIAFRNLAKNKGYSAINIGGLAVGMAVAILIGLWVYDELSFDNYHKNYERVGLVMQHVSFDVEKTTYADSPIPLGDELRSTYPDFESVALARNQGLLVASGDKKFSKRGKAVEPDFLDMMSVKILAGSRAGLKDVNSIMLSESLAEAFFGTGNPLNKVIKIDNKLDVKVTGVYEDFPDNSSFKEIAFFIPWTLAVAKDEYVRRSLLEWDENSFQVYGLLKKGADFDLVSAKIKDVRMKKDNPPSYKPEFFIHPMSKWHLYADFKNGINIGGLIQFVWLFAIIGIFVLLLACINFMNLSTARSQQRAREVGIRKAIGSFRWQLIGQFLSESFLVVFVAFVIAIALAALALPFFNEVAEKEMSILWFNPWFWATGIAFSVLTGFLSGSYPALYLSSFQPLKVLKGTFSVGRFAAVPRKVLVVMQFTVSVTLIIGTIVVFRQIQHAKNRPIGYSRSGLIEVRMNTPELYGHYDAMRSDLKNTGAVKEMSQSSSAVTAQDGGTTDFSWEGKSPEAHPLFMSNAVTHDYGNTIGWRIKEGRDFSRSFSTDTASIILNEAAVKIMDIKSPLGSFVRARGRSFKVVGIVKDIIKENPFSPVNPSFFICNYNYVNTINIKLAPGQSASEALAKVENVFKKYNPGSPFTYEFADEEYSKKFGTEVRVGKLATFFACLAILISCLGLFGLASFVAEQRTKEIAIRKVLGASVTNLWQLLSKDFVILVLISCAISVPLAQHFMGNWLKNYKYHTEISWWIFAATALGALIVTLLTVSFQAIRAALLDPVKSLKSE
ncbi:ABC transporter permease [Dyadobacter sp. CY261]|uniref:ABC transporter permease n=1 Tax=Dyadobacter sp. CY261 TaxID=2907203 RepID=UPI001F325E71|nr:ABC transporter permease [Dyadobacter sp. CY261]MCF0071038.1 ABC transporter permease [Dyadobacter sp. CY261]